MHPEERGENETCTASPVSQDMGFAAATRLDSPNAAFPRFVQVTFVLNSCYKRHPLASEQPLYSRLLL